MSIEKVIFGTLAGLAVGALVGVLFAPEKGTVTRKKITKKSEDYAEVLKSKFDEFVDSVSQKTQDLNDMATEEEEKVKEKIKEKAKA